MCFCQEEIKQSYHEEAPGIVIEQELVDTECAFHVEAPLTLQERDELDEI